MEDVFLKVGEMDEIDAPVQELQPKGLSALEITGRMELDVDTIVRIFSWNSLSVIVGNTNTNLSGTKRC